MKRPKLDPLKKLGIIRSVACVLLNTIPSWSIQSETVKVNDVRVYMYKPNEVTIKVKVEA
jgi:hypothetical protein